MVKRKRISLIGLISLLLFIVGSNSIMTYGDTQRVFDDATLFTVEERQKLTSEASTLANAYDLDIVIVTTSDAKGKTARAYADDFFSNNKRGVGSDLSGILFLIDLDNGEAYLSTSGKGIKYLTDQRVKSIITQVLDSGLKDRKFYEAGKRFLSATKEYLVSGIPSDQHSQPESIKGKNSLTVTEGLASVLAGLLASTGFFFRTKSKNKMKNPTKPVTFRENSQINLLANEDQLVDTTTSNRPISKSEKTDSQAGQSTTHTSSSGNTHGGGGAKF